MRLKQKGRGWMIVLKIIGALVVIGLAFVLYQRFTRGSLQYPDITLNVTSAAFENKGAIPVKYTGRGENVSPDLKIGKLDEKVVSIAILMDDLDFPIGAYNH
jgi:phosphatidylethanolamine-binding protein (PEBP) family uncharacterized protein